MSDRLPRVTLRQLWAGVTWREVLRELASLSLTLAWWSTLVVVGYFAANEERAFWMAQALRCWEAAQ